MISYRAIVPVLLLAGIVFSGPSPAQVAQVVPAAPVCLVDTDVDGDGWGWENGQSCRITTASGNPVAIVGPCVDPDGDGFGWDGSESCFVQQPTSEQVTSVSPVTPDTPVNANPTPPTRFTAVNDTGTVVNGTAVIDVLANDLGNIDPTSVAASGPPSKGSIQINNRTGVVTYIPDAESTGTDTYGYTVRNTDNEISNVATVTIALNASTPCAAPTSKNQTVSVLLIGNSLMNDVQSKLNDLLECGGYSTELATANPGGSSLQQHDTTAATTNLIARGYDLTLLQEQSNSININIAPYAVINSLKNKIEAAGSVMGFFQTWGYQQRDPIQTENILSGYDRVADDFNAPIFHIGRAWDYFYTSHNENPPFSLYLDYAHATDEGKALIAYVLYAYLTDQSPIGLTSFLLSDEKAQLLQNTAWTSYLSNR